MKTRLFDYDDRSLESIYKYAKQLEKMTFREIKSEFEKSPYKSYVNLYDFSESLEVHEEPLTFGTSFNYDAKGQLGNFIERMFFGYDPNGNQEADFAKVGMELKMTPVDKKKDGSFRAGERLSITNISYEEPVEENFYNSHVWEKIKLMLLVHYLRDKTVDRLDYIIEFVSLFNPIDYPRDLDIIINDYKKIINKIKAGKAHELSEGDTLYLGACTKGATAENSWRPQYYGNHEPAKKRNFCFKISYMDYILQTYVLKNNLPYESIIQGRIETSFEDYVVGKINEYKGKNDKELCKLFDRKYNNNKAQWNELAFRMLGIKSNKAEEFEKANIVVKTIRIEENGKNKESMSFPAFKFKELMEEEWENSTIYNYFDTTRFLLVVFKKDGDSYVLQGAKMWNMPYKDLNDTVMNEWVMIRDTIRSGVIFELKKNSNGDIVISNNLPGISDSKILHVRPKAQQAAYKLNNGFIKGDVKRDADELPNGEFMTRQCFWINSNYILRIVKEI